MLHEERAAEQTICGYAQELLGLDYEDPRAFETALSAIAKLHNAARQAVVARAEHEFKSTRPTGPISRQEIEDALNRSRCA